MTYLVDPEAIDHDVEKVIEHLRHSMKERKVSQLAVQQALGWKGSYISQLFNRTKALRVQQFLSILAVLDYSPRDFFEDLFRDENPPVEPVEPSYQDTIAHMEDLMQSLTETFVKLMNGDIERKPDDA